MGLYCFVQSLGEFVLDVDGAIHPKLDRSIHDFGWFQSRWMCLFVDRNWPGLFVICMDLFIHGENGSIHELRLESSEIMSKSKTPKS
jgi:hypothetical protein